MYPVTDIMNAVAALMNDPALTAYTYSAQLPYFNIALENLKDKLQLANVPVTNTTSGVISVVAGATEITQAELPHGLIEIQRLWQRWSGTDNTYIPLQRYEFLPRYMENQGTTSFIPCWAYQEQKIKFFAANVNLDIKIDYIKDVIPPVVSPEGEWINVLNSKNYLTFRTAALCAMFIGENETRAAALNSEAENDWNTLEGISNKGRQAITTRRRPFRAAYRLRGTF